MFSSGKQNQLSFLPFNTDTAQKNMYFEILKWINDNVFQPERKNIYKPLLFFIIYLPFYLLPFPHLVCKVLHSTSCPINDFNVTQMDINKNFHSNHNPFFWFKYNNIPDKVKLWKYCFNTGWYTNEQKYY